MIGRLPRILIVLLISLLLNACGANGFYSVALVTEGVDDIPGGETVDGLLLVLDGRVRVQEDASVAGSVYILEGELALDGSVAGDVVQLGGVLTVGDEARIAGDLRQAGGDFSLAPGAVVHGRLLRGSDVELDLRPDQVEQSPATCLGWASPTRFGGQSPQSADEEESTLSYAESGHLYCVI